MSTETAQTPLRLPEGLFIAGLTGLAYALAYLYEYGYCRHFDLPISFVQVELAGAVAAAIALCVGLLALTVYGNVLFALFGSLLSRYALARSIGFSAVILGWALLAVKFTGDLWNLAWAAFWIAIHFGWPLVFARGEASYEAKLRSIEDAEQKVHDATPLGALQRRISANQTAGLFFLFLLVWCAPYVGEAVAKSKKRYLVLEGSGGGLVLRHYGDTFVLGSYDSRTGSLTGRFSVVKASGDRWLHFRLRETGRISKAPAPGIRQQSP